MSGSEHRYLVIDLSGSQNQDYCAAEGQQKFNRLTRCPDISPFEPVYHFDGIRYERNAVGGHPDIEPFFLVFYDG